MVKSMKVKPTNTEQYKATEAVTILLNYYIMLVKCF